MKTIGVIQASFNVTPLGTRSRLADPLEGTPILRRTVQQVRKSKKLDGVFVLVAESQFPFCRDLLSELDVHIHTIACNPPPWARLMRASRKWSLDGWRGGLGGSTIFDEFVDCRVLAGVLQICPADAVLSIPAAAPLFDPGLADEMISHREKCRDEAPLTFTQAVPGLSGIVLDTALVRELASSGLPISWLFTYKPDQPQKDLIFQSACLDIPGPLRFASGRLIADTDFALGTLREMFAQKEMWSLAEIGQFLEERDERGVAAFPREVEIELTCDDPYPESLLVPRGNRLGRRGVMETDIVRQLAEELCARDDSLCVLGGFGDPLRHPDFATVLDILRPRQLNSQKTNVFGLCVRTSGADLTLENIERLLSHDVDVLSVGLDSWTKETFRRVKGISRSQGTNLTAISARIGMLAKMQHERRSSTPIVVPEFVKANENIHELDDFFDGWLRRSGAASIVGYSDYAGQLPDRSVIGMRPPQRIPCRRLRSRCLVLCDGRVTMCDQDFRGIHTIGNVRDLSLAEIWQSANVRHIRQDHLHRRFDTHPLCTSCSEWHRP